MLHVTDAELDALLTSPQRDDVVEPVVVVASRDGTVVSDGALEQLTPLPCVVVGHGHDRDAPPRHVDLVVEPDVCSLDDVIATVDANPIAATTLALLLRAGPYRSVAAGLVAESAAYSTLLAGPEFARWRARTPRRDRPPSSEPPVLVHHRDETLEIVLNRPHVRNAVNTAMRDGLLEALAVAAADCSISDVQIRGEGKAFCSGGDLDEFGTFDDPSSAHLVRLTTSVGRAIDSIAERVTVHLHGACAGSGIELPAFARTVTADAAATLALPEVSLGLIPGAGGTVSLTSRAGRHRVALLALCGRAIDATTAREWGIVDAVAP